MQTSWANLAAGCQEGAGTAQIRDRMAQGLGPRPSEATQCVRYQKSVVLALTCFGGEVPKAMCSSLSTIASFEALLLHFRFSVSLSLLSI
jgi:hypothetical protein